MEMRDFLFVRICKTLFWECTGDSLAILACSVSYHVPDLGLLENSRFGQVLKILNILYKLMKRGLHIFK